MTNKPAQLYDREVEWRELTEFATSAQPGATLGLMYGRRRQGKTLLLQLLARGVAGFMFPATQQGETQNLADLGAAYAEFRGLRQPVAFRDFREAVHELLRLGEDRPTAVIIDEFPYLVAATPALPSYLQQELSPLGYARQHTQTRMIVCGSALTTMSTLLGGGAPLRGRAQLELIVRPFGYRASAEFWHVEHSPELAVRLDALVGGTPAYKDMCAAGPASLKEFDSWVVRRLLNPASAMFREGNLLLREETSIADPTSYAATLAAISAGNRRRSEIASALGRPSSSLAHLLTGLEDIGMIEHLGDALRGKRSVFRMAEPIVRLHQLVIARHEPELVAGRGTRVWSRSAQTVAEKIYGPHFEDLARSWCLEHAADDSLGGAAGSVLPTEVPCREHRGGHQIDLVVAENVAAGRIASIGEVKATSARVGASELRRLEHVRGLLPAARVTLPPKLLLFSLSGFTSGLAAEADARSDVELVDPDRLYYGS